MLIMYAYDTIEILVEPIKTRSDTDMLRSYHVLYVTLENAVHVPKAPPHIHMRSAAKRAIRTFKTIFCQYYISRQQLPYLSVMLNSESSKKKSLYIYYEHQ